MDVEKRKRIHHYSLFYYILKAFVGIFHKGYYRKIEFTGIENVPVGEPVIFAANHQNALMDALAILFTFPGSIVFLARADIFKSPTLAQILHFLKIMPVFRIRDGAENLNKNDSTFDASMQVLKDNHPLCLMPEGNHGDKRRLRPLVKGIFRIAFQTQEELGLDRPVKIVPVGVDYEHYQHFRKDLFVKYGEPIEVAPYMPLYMENKAKGMNALRERLSEELKKLMIHIEKDEFYDSYHELRQFYTERHTRRRGFAARNLKARFESDKLMIEKLDAFAAENPEGMNKLAASIRELHSIVKEKNFRYWMFSKQPFSLAVLFFRSLALLVLSPLFLAGLLVHYIPFQFPTDFVRRTRLKDMQFFSSFVFVLGILSFTVWSLLLLVLLLVFSPAWYLTLATLLLLPFSGYFTYRYFILSRKTNSVFQFRKQFRAGDKRLLLGISLWKEIQDTMDAVTKVSH